MKIILIIPATVLAAVWIILLLAVNVEDWRIAAFNKVLNNRDEIEKLKLKTERNLEKLSNYHGLFRKFMTLFYEEDFTKKIVKLQNDNKKLQKGKISSVSLLAMPGYVLQRMLPSIGQGNAFRKAVQNYAELSGGKYANYRAKELYARLFSYPLIGIAVSLVITVIFYTLSDLQTGAIFGGMSGLLVVILTYAQYDEVADRINKRRAAISRQFPNVVSKLALLVTSGMIMDKAWKETAYSQGAELYLEMRKTAEELDNLMTPEAAYANFISRCNTKETAKLASAIIQNLSKGNAEIGSLLKGLASEAWMERQHTARKDGDKANSLLMIPTMLLFLSILIMILVPAMTNMSF